MNSCGTQFGFVDCFVGFTLDTTAGLGMAVGRKSTTKLTLRGYFNPYFYLPNRTNFTFQVDLLQRDGKSGSATRLPSQQDSNDKLCLHDNKVGGSMAW